MSDSKFESTSFFVLQLTVGPHSNREEMLSSLWSELYENGLQGVHEGTVLCDEATEKGFDIESFTVDAGLAPRERDWISTAQELNVELYFASEAEALSAQKYIANHSNGLSIAVSAPQLRKTEDWNAKWKASFQGIDVDPFWMVLPPWRKDELETLQKTWPKNKRVLWLNPGAGFGTGTHETTQLCLETLGLYSRINVLSGKKVLDFGSGSGILSIGAALMGAHALGVEIDELANDNATENAEFNGLNREMISFQTDLPTGGEKYEIVLANILRPILLQFSEKLVERIQPKGLLVLSGLVATDLPEVISKYSSLLGGRKPLIREKGDWRALVWDLSLSN